MVKWSWYGMFAKLSIQCLMEEEKKSVFFSCNDNLILEEEQTINHMLKKKTTIVAPKIYLCARMGDILSNR